MMILQGAILRKTAMGAAQRRLVNALAVSAAAHLLVLWPVSLAHRPLKLAQPMTATLRERPPLADGAPVTPAAQAVPVPKPFRRTPSPRRAMRGDAVPVLLGLAPQRARRPETKPDAIAKTAEAPPSSAENEPVATATMAPRMNGDAAAQAVATANNDGADANALRRYRFAVSRAARTDYPRLAVERGWTGTAQVRVAIDRNGQLRRVSLADSSGHAVLDAKAQTIIGLAAEATALPAALLGHEFFVDFPVEFRLEDSIAHR